MRGFLVFAVLLLVGVAPWLSACDENPSPTRMTQGVTDTSGSTPAPPRATFTAVGDLPVVEDPETGCQYIGYATHGLTPRVVWDEQLQTLTQMGCRIKHVTLKDPTTGEWTWTPHTIHLT